MEEWIQPKACEGFWEIEGQAGLLLWIGKICRNEFRRRWGKFGKGKMEGESLDGYWERRARIEKSR